MVHFILTQSNPVSCVQIIAGKHVVFGKVIKGYEIVKKVAEVPVDDKDRPLSPVVISNCGELELRKPPGTSFQIIVEVRFF
jgi:cyclophilin family peptidyl-prolyl cis-trans isomerase